jgi:hypothetical protein
MPSDPRVARALEVLARPLEQYRSALAATLEEVRGHLASGRSDAAARAERLRDQLGPFAGGRIDAARLAALLGQRDALDASALQRLERAFATLQQLVAPGADLFHVEVIPGGDVHACVSAQLARIGRAFSAARVAAAARSGGAVPGLDEEAALDRFPFAQWSGAERRLAPPLVVTVRGEDLVAGALAPFLDGAAKLLLIVEGPCAPAALVRLIAPSVLVVQAHALEELDLLGPWPGAAVGALVAPPAVRFVHDPSGGPAVWQRLTVHGAADLRPGRIGGFTAAQQQDELNQLHALAAPPPAAPLPASAGTPAPAPAAAPDPADRLAAWLLQQANVAPALTGE